MDIPVEIISLVGGLILSICSVGWGIYQTFHQDKTQFRLEKNKVLRETWDKVCLILSPINVNIEEENKKWDIEYWTDIPMFMVYIERNCIIYYSYGLYVLLNNFIMKYQERFRHQTHSNGKDGMVHATEEWQLVDAKLKHELDNLKREIWIKIRNEYFPPQEKEMDI
jgi:hypothetical protein